MESCYITLTEFFNVIPLTEIKEFITIVEFHCYNEHNGTQVLYQNSVKEKKKFYHCNGILMELCYNSENGIL